jgi:hypothetical protein
VAKDKAHKGRTNWKSRALAAETYAEHLDERNFELSQMLASKTQTVTVEQDGTVYTSTIPFHKHIYVEVSVEIGDVALLEDGETAGVDYVLAVNVGKVVDRD